MGIYLSNLIYGKKIEYTQRESNLTETKNIFDNAHNNYIVQKITPNDLEYMTNTKDSKTKTKNEQEGKKIKKLIEILDYLENLDKKNISKNKNKSNACIHNIKSKYRLKEIFNKLQRKKLLQIIKHNKNLQKILNIDNNDYKEYCEIEIELIPKLNQSGKFINFLGKENKNIFIYILIMVKKK